MSRRFDAETPKRRDLGLFTAGVVPVREVDTSQVGTTPAENTQEISALQRLSVEPATHLAFRVEAIGKASKRRQESKR